VVLYRCETCSLTLKEDLRLRVSENRLLRRILGPNRDEVTGDWRTLHNEELHNMCSSSNIIRMINMNDQVKEYEIDRARSTNEDKRNAYRILVGKPEGKRPLGRPRRRWVDNVKMDLRVRIGWYELDGSESGQGPVEGSCEHGNEPLGSRKF
jgi:hypothetical protein